MALDQRKRQKQAEKRKAKQKVRQKALITNSQAGLTHQLQRAAAAPILHCCMQDTLTTEGICQLLLSRSLPNGDVAFTILLLDTYCLGVKSAMANIMSWISYQEKITSGFRKDFAMVDLSPAAARKLVEGAVAYAKELGLRPHADYQKAQLLFGDIDASTCTDEFTYGKDGKPLFVAGPYDSLSRCAQIVGILTSRVGADGFDYVIPVWADMKLLDTRWDDEEDDDFEADFDE